MGDEVRKSSNQLLLAASNLGEKKEGRHERRDPRNLLASCRPEWGLTRSGRGVARGLHRSSPPLGPSPAGAGIFRRVSSAGSGVWPASRCWLALVWPCSRSIWHWVAGLTRSRRRGTSRCGPLGEWLREPRFWLVLAVERKPFQPAALPAKGACPLSPSWWPAGRLPVWLIGVCSFCIYPPHRGGKWISVRSACEPIESKSCAAVSTASGLREEEGLAAWACGGLPHASTSLGTLKARCWFGLLAA